MANILVVEDDKDLNRSVCSYFEANDYTVKPCFNGAEALIELEKQSFDLILSDIMMPIIDGFSLVEKVRKLDEKVRSIPVALSLIVGIIGTLIFGLGMAMILEWSILVWGILICIIGLIPCGFAYPIFNLSTKHMKEKYSSEIIALSEELLNEKGDAE